MSNSSYRSIVFVFLFPLFLQVSSSFPFFCFVSFLLVMWCFGGSLLLWWCPPLRRVQGWWRWWWLWWRGWQVTCTGTQTLQHKAGYCPKFSLLTHRERERQNIEGILVGRRETRKWQMEKMLWKNVRAKSTEGKENRRKKCIETSGRKCRRREWVKEGRVERER